MALSHSPRIVTDGLKLLLDAANRKSTINAAPPSLINTYGWTVSSGSIGIYGQNGPTNENARLYSTDPWGNQSIVWGTFPDGSNQADGGWNTNFLNIDRTKLYRFSVWVRRTSPTTGGTFYFGTNSNGGVFSVADGTQKGNPYWECSGTGKLVQNQWYLVCGHIYPVNTNITTNHPDSAYFTVSGGAVPALPITFCNIVSDLKWGPTSTNVQHRTYHYYCADNTTRLQFAFPRIDECDGNQPSIGELLSNGDSQWKDLSGNGNHHSLMNTPAYENDRFNLNETQSINRPTAITGAGNNNTVVIWYSTTDIQELWVRGNSSGSHYLSASIAGNYYHSNVGTPINFVDLLPTIRPDSPINYKTGVFHMWEAKNVDFSNWNSYEWFGYGGSWNINGSIGTIMIYDRYLTSEESMQNFNAFKGRYNI